MARGAATSFQVQNADAVVGLQDVVATLSDSRAIALAQNPPVPPIPGFGANLRKDTGEGARSYLKRLLTLTTGDAESLGKWQASLAL